MAFFRLWLISVRDDMVTAGLFRQAAGMAYVTLLSLVPSVAVSVSLVTYLIPQGLGREIVGRLQELLLSSLTEGKSDRACHWAVAVEAW